MGCRNVRVREDRHGHVNVSKMQALEGKKTYPGPDTRQINELAFLGNE